MAAGPGNDIYVSNELRASEQLLTDLIEPFTSGGSVQIIGFGAGNVVNNITELEIRLGQVGPAGAKFILGKGTYIVERTLVIPSNVSLCGAGLTILQAADGLDDHIVSIENGATNVNVSDIKFIGNSANQTDNNIDLINIDDSTEICINKCCFSDSKRSCIRTGGNSEKIWITGCVFNDILNPLGACIFATSTNCLTIKCCCFVAIGNNVAPISLGSAAEVVLVTYCIFEQSAGLVLSAGTESCVISNNIFKNPLTALPMIASTSSTLLTINNNQMINAGRGIVLTSCNDANVTDNTIIGTGGPGIDLLLSINTKITGNTIDTTGSEAILLNNPLTDDTLISQNVIRSSLANLFNITSGNINVCSNDAVSQFDDPNDVFLDGYAQKTEINIPVGGFLGAPTLGSISTSESSHYHTIELVGGVPPVTVTVLPILLPVGPASITFNAVGDFAVLRWSMTSLGVFGWEVYRLGGTATRP